MLAGIDFYKRAVELQKRFWKPEQQNIANHIQTNLTLLNEKWIEFFKENSFKISTSIDGSERLHDRYRHYKSGNGSFKKVVAGIEALRKVGMSFGVVVTINRFNVGFPDEVYQTLMELGIKGFELNLATESIGRESLAPPEDDAIRFLKRSFDIWFEADDPTIHVRLFVNVLRALIGLPLRDCSFSRKSLLGVYCM